VHAFPRNLRSGFDDLDRVIGATTAPLLPAMVQDWAALATYLLAG